MQREVLDGVAVEVVTRDPIVHRPNEGTQARDIVVRRTFRQETARQGEEGGAHLVDVVGLGRRQLPHEHAAIGDLLDQSGRFKGTKGFPDRTSADPETKGEFLLVDFIAGS